MGVLFHALPAAERLLGDRSFAARCSMRLRVRHLCLALIPLAVLLAIAVGDDVDRHYCTSCGLIRLADFRTFLGLGGPRMIRYRETEFHRALLSTGHVECSHRWRAFYWNHHHVHRDEVHIPIILTDHGWSGGQLDLLSRLEDPDKIATILTSLDLSEVLDERHLNDDGPAFEALKAVPHAIGEQEWWARYRHLFVGRLPPDPALQWIRPAGHAVSGG
jgi:hypothetical protein